MIIELDEQAQEVLGTAELVIITERVDDVALLLGQMIKMGLVEVLDNHLPKHWKQRGLSWGWTAVIWLAYILTEGDHRKVSVEAYVRGMKRTLSQVTGQAIEPLDFSDDRLAGLLRYLSQPKYWHPIEQELNGAYLLVGGGGDHCREETIKALVNPRQAEVERAHPAVGGGPTGRILLTRHHL